MKLSIAMIFALMCVVAWNIRTNYELNSQIIQLSLDKEEIVQHANILVGIIKEQQYQIDTIFQMLQDI